MEGVGWIGAIIIGGIAGWIAEKVLGGDHGILTSIGLGIVGALRAMLLIWIRRGVKGRA